jgi:transposase
MCRPSLVHPEPIRQLRDVTRYRRSLVREQTREKQRLEKTLEDAQINLQTTRLDQGVEHRLPIHARGFHRHVGDCLADQPGGQLP